ncbi:hypothetical protein BB987_19630 [Photorhabdus temperata]|uniref:Uncharacterized protein n=1 Tax=Photorhabdus khanii NC19 TaxID=1004151 RepID=W3V2T3_9GAMM|nr:hypothetical protein PTE_03580 [Photorhabdus khanii NC19]OHV49396.1 hypothetical protein BB987_19630 [Photorhabdus temperata]
MLTVIKNLGLTADFLVEKQLIRTGRFEYMFEGDEAFFCKPESGLRLVSFWMKNYLLFPTAHCSFPLC